MFAIDIQFQPRIVEVLRNEHIVNRTQRLHPRSHRPGESKRFIQFTAPDSNVDRSRLSLVNDGIDQSTCLEISAHFWKVAREPFAQTLHVSEAAGLMVLLETDLNEGGMHSGIAGIDGRKIWRNAYIRHDHIHPSPQDEFRAGL